VLTDCIQNYEKASNVMNVGCFANMLEICGICATQFKLSVNQLSSVDVITSDYGPVHLERYTQVARVITASAIAVRVIIQRPRAYPFLRQQAIAL
jgi:hypothetical protein